VGIRLAGANGLQKLIQSRSGIQWGFEVFDEPTQHLSEKGIADLLDYLEAKAKTEQRQIWLITHTGLTAGNFDGQIEIVKGVKGSRIVEVA
jgi:DNA repair exonuclease SbcCD ATPase subunit